MHVDWWSGTTMIEGSDAQRQAIAQIKSWLLGDWRPGKGRHSYRDGWRHESGATILAGGQDGMGIHVVLPGGALAHFGDNTLLLWAGYEWRASRLDIAVDIPDMRVEFLGEDLVV